MKRAQLLVLGIAVAAGLGAMLMTRGAPPPPPTPEPVAYVAPAPRVQTTPVLVAAVDIPMGQTLRSEDLRWLDWPADSVPAGLVTSDQGIETAAGAMTRVALLAGEPIRPERLIRGGNGFMSAILPQGMRALAISIDTRGATSAGGFVLPNDRVDVIRTVRDEGGGDSHSAQTILRNIRVLAIGKNVQTDERGNSYVDGETATLEVTPSQAEMLTLAQRTGQLALVLRSLADASPAEDVVEETESNGLTIVRFGVPRQTTTP
ncbi:Flp pilus assembly protein CpaB [Salinarimonas sp.]|uniref:Flp pilus assembly protein CpaB n=1 Tax=Salinarimonas sp. TaxID=2766526 RepID=UPI00391D6A60